eukprot:TRINITY_DN70868_c0_g1_i1.p1 TRINITY_DN70868_c0_g1~~TRINITY_DN70868_c0_g1_i1.p1  ORF type:complete len:285 (+),score=83.72 TRINITY_DN70868_c0_g1_i1:86-940(+)
MSMSMSVSMSSSGLSSPPSNPEAVRRMRAVFAELDALAKGSGREEDVGRNRLLIMREFGQFFEVAVDAEREDAAAQGSSLRPLSPVRGRSHSPLSVTESTPAPGIAWDQRTSAAWTLQNNDATASVNAASGWRTLMAEQTLPRGRASYFTVAVHALRILAVGVLQGNQPPADYAGDSAASWAYQSSGHLLHGGPVQGEDGAAPGFAAGDTVGVLVDPVQRSVCFYKNGRLAGMPFIDIVQGGDLRICISAYLGPCTFSVDPEPFGDAPTENAMAFPVFIGDAGR